MKKIKYLRIAFEGSLRPHEIPALRAAVIEKVGRRHDVFHNHGQSSDTFQYRYPLIQYKSIKGQPAILCLDDGADQIHRFFTKKDWTLHVSDRELSMKVASMDMKQYTLQAWDRSFSFNIRNWIALNQQNYEAYQELEGLSDKLHFLEKKLTGNILSFAKGMDWHVDKPIKVAITHLEEPRWVKLKGKKVLGFTLDFSTNVFIPNFVGLGKSVSLGYGTVVQRKPS